MPRPYRGWACGNCQFWDNSEDIWAATHPSASAGVCQAEGHWKDTGSLHFCAHFVKAGTIEEPKP